MNEKFRVIRVSTRETIMIFEATDLFEASRIVGKIYGADNEDIDIDFFETEQED